MWPESDQLISFLIVPSINMCIIFSSTKKHRNKSRRNQLDKIYLIVLIFEWDCNASRVTAHLLFLLWLFLRLLCFDSFEIFSVSCTRSSLYNLLYWRYSVFLFVHFYISFFLFLNSKKSCENCDLFNQLKNKTRKRNTELKDYVNWSRKSEQIKKKKEGEEKNQDIDYGKRILFNAKL